MKNKLWRVLTQRLIWCVYQWDELRKGHRDKLSVCVDIFQLESADPAYLVGFYWQKLYILRIEVKFVCQIIRTVYQVIHFSFTRNPVFSIQA